VYSRLFSRPYGKRWQDCQSFADSFLEPLPNCQSAGRADVPTSRAVGTVYIRVLCGLLWFALLLPVAAVGQPTPSTSTSTSHSVGTTNATFVWTSFTTCTTGCLYCFPDFSLGFPIFICRPAINPVPTEIRVGDFGSCILQPPPYPSCTLQSGTGTVADPYLYSCSSALMLTNCSLPGTPKYVFQNGNIDTHTHTEVAAMATEVPLGPWVPMGAALGVALLARGRLRAGRQ